MNSNPTLVHRFYSGALFALLALLPAAVFAAEWDTIRPAGSEVEKVAEGFKFTEGPAWHPQGFLLFTDIPNEKIVKLDANGKLSDFYTDSGRCNGLMCDQTGAVYACQGGEGNVIRLNAEGKLQGMVASEFEGKSLNSPNDLAIDTEGGLYFTDPYYGPERELPQPTMAVYYCSKKGELARVVSDLERPNGVTISPDGKHLYVAEPNKGEVYRYNITRPGQLSEGKLIFTGDKELDGSGPDGMTHDEQGNLYCTYNGITVLNPEGKVLGRIATPEHPANCTFGGEDRQTLYITARTGLYKIKLGVSGIALPKRGPMLADARSDTVTAQLVSDTKETPKTNTVELGAISLEVPVDWNKEQPSSRMRLAQFNIPAAEGDKDATELAVFPPFGGSVDDNITRWVNQFDNDGRKASIVKGTSEQGDYYMADLQGTYKKPDGPPFLRKTIDAPGYRMVAVMLTVENQGNYFLKMVGPEKSVAAAVDSFRASFGGDKSTEKEYEVK